MVLHGVRHRAPCQNCSFWCWHPCLLYRQTRAAGPAAVQPQGTGSGALGGQKACAALHLGLVASRDREWRRGSDALRVPGPLGWCRRGPEQLRQRMPQCNGREGAVPKHQPTFLLTDRRARRRCLDCNTVAARWQRRRCHLWQSSLATPRPPPPARAPYGPLRHAGHCGTKNRRGRAPQQRGQHGGSGGRGGWCRRRWHRGVGL